MYVQMFMVIPGLGSRSRSEPIFFGCSVPAEEKNQESEAEPLQKKRGAGAAQKNQEPEPLKKNQEPEPPKLGGPGSLWLIIKQIGTGAPLTPPPPLAL